MYLASLDTSGTPILNELNVGPTCILFNSSKKVKVNTIFSFNEEIMKHNKMTLFFTKFQGIAKLFPFKKINVLSKKIINDIKVQQK